MKTRTLKQVQYEDCNECPLFETPDEDGKISIPNGGTLVIHPFRINKEGKEIPNNISGRCGYTGYILRGTDGCDKWFNVK